MCSQAKAPVVKYASVAEFANIFMENEHLVKEKKEQWKKEMLGELEEYQKSLEKVKGKGKGKAIQSWFWVC